jgi:hypothetical protein
VTGLTGLHVTRLAALVLDPDGYNIEAVFHGGPTR